MKKILVPTDFSAVSEHALDFARQIARAENCTIQLMNVIEHPSASTFKTMGINEYDPMESIYIKKMIENVTAKMDEITGSADFAGINIQSKVVVGNPFVEITEDIVNTETDLVVMGSEGAEGMEEFFVGSNAEKVIRTATCPVVTIKSKTNIEDINDIVFASDFKSSQEGIVAYVKEMQKLFNAKLHLVTINTPSSFTSTRHDLEMMEEFIETRGIEDYTVEVYNDFQEEEGIINYAQDIDADMIALGTYGRTGIYHFLAGSIAEDVANHSQRPVWTFRIGEK